MVEALRKKGVPVAYVDLRANSTAFAVRKISNGRWMAKLLLLFTRFQI